MQWNKNTKDDFHPVSRVSTLLQNGKKSRRAYAMAFEKPFW